MDLEKCRKRKKRKESFSPFPSLFSARFLPLAHLLPAAQLSLPPLARYAAQHLRRPSPAPAQLSAAVQQPLPRLLPQPLTPGPHLSAPSPSPRGSATARARRLSNRRPRTVRRGSVFPRSSVLINRSRAPPRVPCCFPEPFSLAFAPRKPRNRALRISAGHRPRHPRRRLLRASPSSFFPAVRIPSLSSFSPALFFGVRWVLAP